MYAYDMKSS